MGNNSRSIDVVYDKQEQILVNNYSTKKTSRPNNESVSKSDLNKMIFFINNPERYATGTRKATEKVDYLKSTFAKIKSSLDEETIKNFNEAMEKYNRKASSL